MNFGRKTEHQKAILALDKAVSDMVRAQFPDVCASCESTHPEYDCGHWIKRERMATRFHPYNIYPQGLQENRFEGGKEWEFGMGIDKRWGDGTCVFLKNLAEPKHGKGANPDEGWTTDELKQLRSAATKFGWNAYIALYRELRPSHFP